MGDSFDDILDQAQQMTDKQFHEVIAANTKLTAEELADLDLTSEEKLKLLELIKIVKKAANKNDKYAAIMAAIGTYGSLAVKLIVKAIA